jgi:hypothetical protein
LYLSYLLGDACHKYDQHENTTCFQNLQLQQSQYLHK